MAIQKTSTQILNDAIANNQILENIPYNWALASPYLNSGEINPAFLGLTPVQKLAHYYSRISGTPFYGKNPLDALAFAEDVKRQSSLPKTKEITAYDQLDLDNNDILKEWGVTSQNLRGTPNYSMPEYAKPVPIDEVITNTSTSKPTEDSIVTAETPTSTADTDVVIKSPVYDRPAYTNKKDLLSLDELAKVIIAGNKYGNGEARKQALMNEGYTPEEIKNVQQIVNKSMRKPVVKANTVTNPVIKNNVDSVIARPTVTNTPVQPVNNTNNVPTGYNPSGYATGHEAYYDPIAGQLKFR